MADSESKKSALDNEAAWKALFKNLVQDEETGSIKISDLEDAVEGISNKELRADYNIQAYQLKSALKDLKKADKDKNEMIDEEEWVNIYQEYNTGGKIGLLSAFEVLMYEPTYSWFPPPIFILSLSVIQVGFYIWHSVHISSIMGEDYQRSLPPATCSYLIYDPSKRQQVWRFLTYQFVHAGAEHIVFNMVMQLMVGFPLELSQRGWLGKLKLMTLYMAGVLMGSVAGAIPSRNSLLCGASAGVYALIAAHLATLIINWKEDGAVFKKRKTEERHVSMSLNPLLRGLRLAFIVSFTTFDIGYALYGYYTSDVSSSTSYSGHLAGALTGLLLGLALLDNRKVLLWEKILKKVSIALYFILLLIGLLWHIIGSFTNEPYFGESKTDQSCEYFSPRKNIDQSHI